MSLWLTKLLLAHFLSDFMLRKNSWMEDIRKKHFGSIYLYLHTLITAATAFLLLGWKYWMVAVIIFITHTVIDGIMSYLRDEPASFLINQALHLLVILLCWWFSFRSITDFNPLWQHFSGNTPLWINITGYFFVTAPAGFVVGQLTKKWRAQLENAEGLANAGKWIGILERVMVLTFVLLGQFASIGLLMAAKGIIRFGDNQRTEVKTEYLVIGTLWSIGIAVIAGLAMKAASAYVPA
jgi:hypothetical protein